jgi:hypothetical protein
MARTSSPPYNETNEVTISASALQQRWKLLSEGLRVRCQLASEDLFVHPDNVGEKVTAGLLGRACERVQRNMGRPAFVAPFTQIGRSNLKSWLGFQEQWELASRDRYSFHHVSLTVHFGYENEITKPQIFRSEWPGVRRWGGQAIGFQSPGAGHPHWQFDLIESISKDDVRSEQKILARLRDQEIVVDFQSPSSVADSIVAARSVSLQRMHFASAAPWWLNSVAGQDLHTNAPKNPNEILRWILACVTYMRQELDRCELDG